LESDQVYFARRAREERVAAMKAPHPAARKSHFEMADRYDDLAQAIRSQPPVDQLGRTTA
jgi:hypothetical protein